MIINTSDGQTMTCQEPAVQDLAIVSFGFQADNGGANVTICNPNAMKPKNNF